MYIKQNSFEKHLDILKEKFIMGLKGHKEYKVQFWAIIFTDLSIIFSYNLFYLVYGPIIDNLLKWTKQDYFIMLIVILLISKINVYIGFRRFTENLLRGNLNQHILRPASTYFLESLNMFVGGGIISTILIWILYIILILINYDFFLIIFSIPVFILGILYFHIFQAFLESISFFMKRNFLYDLINKQINHTNEKYTPKVFEGSFFKYLFFVLPSAVYGYFIIESLKGNFSEFFIYLPYILISFILMIIGTYFLWKFGLKKYEAYN